MNRLAQTCFWSFLLSPVAALIGAVLLVSAPVEAQQFASTEQRAAALGHYARARALLVEALAEFEQGKQIARPDLLVDPEQWRLGITSRAEDLNRLLDPKPRITRSGVRFKATARLIGRENDRLPRAPAGPRDANDYGEAQRETELSEGRARMGTAETADALEKESLAEISGAAIQESIQTSTAAEESAIRADHMTTPVSDAQESETTASAVLTNDSQNITSELPEEDSDEEINQAIEWAIKQRLERMKQTQGPQ